MPRVARIELQEKQLFHIMVQGVNKEKIFNTDNEKNEYVKLLKNNEKKYEMNIISYCVMTNHVHMLVYTKSIEMLTKYMHVINSSYAKYYNKSNNRVGYVYRDRYKIQVIRNENHLYNCIIYIHNNPVKAKMCNNPEKYIFSSYKSFFDDNKLSIAKKYFVTKEAYQKAHTYCKDNCIDFIEDSESIDFNIKNDIEVFIKKKNIHILELKYNNNYACEIATFLHNNYKLSSRKIADYLGINREKVRRLIE